MTAPALARNVGDLQGGWRYYPWPPPPEPEAEKLPSVTTITGLAPSGTLAGWGARLAVEAIEAGMPGDEAKHAHRRALMEASAAGTAAHEAIECWINKIPYAPAMEGYVSAARDALEAMQIKPEMAEVTLYAPALGYAGTADLIGSYPDGQLALVDWKTGNVHWPTRALQMGALSGAKHAAIHLLGDIWSLEPAPVFARAIGISVRRDGTWDWKAYDPPELQAAHRAFMLLREYWDWHIPQWSL